MSFFFQNERKGNPKSAGIWVRPRLVFVPRYDPGHGGDFGDITKDCQKITWSDRGAVWVYRSKHELVFVFKVGSAPHLNTFGLGDTGRYRTNVWDYSGVNSFRAGRMEELALHPTVKPVALVADAMKDCSRRGDIVLDPFGGSGTTLIAAQKSGRKARLIEYDPAYCDVILRRFEATTGDGALLAKNGQSFEDVAEQRIGSPGDTNSNREDQNPELHGMVSQ